jgi:hypothetical protein
MLAWFIKVPHNTPMSNGYNNEETTTAPKTYLMRYEPARHLGEVNFRAEEFTYHLATNANVDGEFFYANDLDNEGALKRFNTYNTIEIISLEA